MRKCSNVLELFKLVLSGLRFSSAFEDTMLVVSVEFKSTPEVDHIPRPAMNVM